MTQERTSEEILQQIFRYWDVQYWGGWIQSDNPSDREMIELIVEQLSPEYRRAFIDSIEAFLTSSNTVAEKAFFIRSILTQRKFTDHSDEQVLQWLRDIDSIVTMKSKEIADELEKSIQEYNALSEEERNQQELLNFLGNYWHQDSAMKPDETILQEIKRNLLPSELAHTIDLIEKFLRSYKPEQISFLLKKGGYRYIENNIQQGIDAGPILWLNSILEGLKKV